MSVLNRAWGLLDSGLGELAARLGLNVESLNVAVDLAGLPSTSRLAREFATSGYESTWKNATALLPVAENGNAKPQDADDEEGLAGFPIDQVMKQRVDFTYKLLEAVASLVLQGISQEGWSFCLS